MSRRLIALCLLLSLGIVPGAAVAQEEPEDHRARAAFVGPPLPLDRVVTQAAEKLSRRQHPARSSSSGFVLSAKDARWSKWLSAFGYSLKADVLNSMGSASEYPGTTAFERYENHLKRSHNARPQN